VSKKELYAAFGRIGLNGSAKDRARPYGIILIIVVIIILMLITITITKIFILLWRKSCMRHSRESALQAARKSALGSTVLFVLILLELVLLVYV